MTEDNSTETGGDAGGENSEDSSVIKTLRSKLADAEKQLKAQPSRSELEAEIRASVARENAIERELVSLGQPPAVRKLVEEKLDGEVTAEAVTEAVTALGFQVTGQDEGEDSGQELDEVASLGNQVASAASGNKKQSVEERIANAQSPAEVAAIMAEVEAQA